jgi:hypothetical protein
MIRLRPCLQPKAAILRRTIAHESDSMLSMFFWGFSPLRGDPACDAARGSIC